MTGRRRIAIAAQDDRGLEGEVGAHFGRCPFYVMVDLEGEELTGVRLIRNPYFGAHQPGVMPGFLQEHGAEVVLAGAMGPRAIRMFEGRGIAVATGATGTVDAVLDAYLQGKLRDGLPCSLDHPERCDEHRSEPPGVSALG